VAATSILIALINSNKNITRTLQAYHLAQEGLEAVRNIRDTNWLNNLEYLGVTDPTSSIWDKIEIGSNYAIFVDIDNTGTIGGTGFPSDLTPLSPWKFYKNPDDDDKKICLRNEYFSNCAACSSPDCAPTEFSRVIRITDYCNEDKKNNSDKVCLDYSEDSSYQPKAVVVTSTVKFGNKEVSLDTVLTDWKTNPL